MHLTPFLTETMRRASKFSELPILKILSPRVDCAPKQEDLIGFKNAQDLALKAAREIAGFLREGWTEKQTAKLLNTWLRDNGVQSFFHYAYVWFGERTRFDGISRKRYQDFMPSNRVLLENEVFILDVAPIVNGYICDIGYTGSLGIVPKLDEALEFLSEIKTMIPSLFKNKIEGREIWNAVDKSITDKGYENIHSLYPFHVLGHRVYKTKTPPLPSGKFLNFGAQSYWNILSRGIFNQLLDPNYAGNLLGLWAVEPHIGNPTFGAKFEEILVVNEDDVYWLSERELSK